jgi:hypothetical protein
MTPSQIVVHEGVKIIVHFIHRYTHKLNRVGRRVRGGSIPVEFLGIRCYRLPDRLLIKAPTELLNRYHTVDLGGV